MKSKTAITITGLSKRYPGTDRLALDNLSISVNPGEVYGFLGPNGAGKSTTIRMLMNFIQPTSGSATILGQDVVKNSVNVKKSVGYLSSDMTLYNKMSGKQFLSYMNALKPAQDPTYVQKLAKQLKVDLHKKLGELSRGNRQKVNIIQALMNKPDVLILDEPTSGLDPLMQEEFYSLILKAKKRGACIFMSSHILSEVQKICDRVGIISGGKLVAERNINEMAQDAAHIFDIVFADAAPVAQLKKIKGVKLTSHSGPTATIHVHGELSPMFQELANHHVLKIDARNLDLENVFLQYYQEKGAKR